MSFFKWMMTSKQFPPAQIAQDIKLCNSAVLRRKLTGHRSAKLVVELRSCSWADYVFADWRRWFSTLFKNNLIITLVWSGMYKNYIAAGLKTCLLGTNLRKTTRKYEYGSLKIIRRSSPWIEFTYTKRHKSWRNIGIENLLCSKGN